MHCAALLRYGGPEGDRTPDLVIANDALSQLSYGPSTWATNCIHDTLRNKGGSAFLFLIRLQQEDERHAHLC